MNLNSRSALVVLSGGQDSTTCLGWALDNFEHVSAVTIDYGQKHKIELEAAAAVVKFYSEKFQREIPHEIIYLQDGIFAGCSPLTNKDELLETYPSFEEMESVIGARIEKTFVPMRNAVFLMLAANRAVVKDIGNLVTGVCMMDNANYPDCRPEFISRTTDAINSALGLRVDNGIEIKTPLMYLDKAETVHMALRLPFAYSALAYSHTAYDGNYPPTGSDHASLLRARGFEQANVPDPLVLRAVNEGLMNYPTTENYSAPNVFDGQSQLVIDGVIKDNF